MQDEEEYYYRSELIIPESNDNDEEDFSNYDPLSDIESAWEALKYLKKDGFYLFNQGLLFIFGNQEHRILKGTWLASFLKEDLNVASWVIAAINQSGWADYEEIYDEANKIVEIEFWTHSNMDELYESIRWDLIN